MAILPKEAIRTVNHQAPPFGGWLILLGIHMMVLFVRRMFRLYLLYSNVFDPANIPDLLISGNFALPQAGGTWFIASILLNLIVLYIIVQLIMLYLAKNSAFLTWFPLVVLAALAVTIIETFQILQVTTDPVAYRFWAITGVVYALVPLLWIPYLRRSKRVRETFIL